MNPLDRSVGRPVRRCDGTRIAPRLVLLLIYYNAIKRSLESLKKVIYLCGAVSRGACESKVRLRLLDMS